jgi:hypothetical protein
VERLANLVTHSVSETLQPDFTQLWFARKMERKEIL